LDKNNAQYKFPLNLVRSAPKLFLVRKDFKANFTAPTYLTSPFPHGKKKAPAPREKTTKFFGGGKYSNLPAKGVR